MKKIKSYSAQFKIMSLKNPSQNSNMQSTFGTQSAFGLQSTFGTQSAFGKQEKATKKHYQKKTKN